MRKMKKINGFLVVRFNDREKRDNPTLGSFGVINAEDYTGDLDYDLDAMEYIDADLIEIAVEQARGLNAEEDFDDEPTTYTVIAEKAEKATEETVEPKALALSWQRRLETQIKSKHYPDIDPRTAVHELSGYKAALRDLGLLEEDETIVEPNVFGDACAFYDDEGHRVDMILPTQTGLALVTAHDYEEGETFTNCTVQTLKCRRCGRESFAWSKGPVPDQEETLAYICDEVCKYREGRTQEELDAICAKCKVDRWAGAPPTLTPREVLELRNLQGLLKEVEDYVNGGGAATLEDKATDRSVRRLEMKLPEGVTLKTIQKLLNAARNSEPPRETFENAPSEVRNDYNTRKAYALGLALARECPDNDCRVYLNIFNAAKELDAALDKAGGSTAVTLALQSALRVKAGELWRMYENNYAVQKFKEGMQK